MSYNEKHNEANGEQGRDGESHNRSYNLGVEGPTDDHEINTLRARQQRNFLATLILSQGVPMLVHGDELGRTQLGNNNGYAQDNELTWINWENADEPLIEFVRSVAALRAKHPTFRRRQFFNGKVAKRTEGAPLPDIVWLNTDGTHMNDEDWNTAFVKSMGMYLNGDAIVGRDRFGDPLNDDSFLCYFNASDTTVPVTLPGHELSFEGTVVIDTASAGASTRRVGSGQTLELGPRSMVVIREHSDVEQTDASAAASVAALEHSRSAPAPDSESRQN